jgi:membrane associated rhomboid family serine protease
MIQATEVAVRTAPDEATAREWTVVLGAAGVPCRAESTSGGWAVVVPAADETRASDALAAYDQDVAPSPGPDELEYGPTLMGLLLAASLVVAYFFTGFRAANRPWFVAGEGTAVLIADGQWWRAVTALFLHADATHLAGNVVGMAILGTAVCRLLGPGLGAATIVLSGATGNLLNGWIRGAPHVSVGASTAIFGAVGILVGLAMLRARPSRRRSWVPFAAGLALLGFLGTGEQADLAAHFFGFQAGVGFGMSSAVLFDATPSPRAQRWLGLGTLVVVLASWALAIAMIPHATTPHRR